MSYIDNKASEEYHGMTDEKKGDLKLDGIMKVAKSEKEVSSIACVYSVCIYSVCIVCI